MSDLSGAAKAAEGEARSLWQRVRGQEPASAWSAWVFMIPGTVSLWLFPGLKGGVLLLTSFAVSLGTFVYHWRQTRGHDDLDRAGMAAELAAVTVLLAGWWWWLMLAAALAAAFVLVYNQRTRFSDRVWVAGFGLLAAIALGYRGQWVMLAGSLAAALAGFYYWRKPYSSGTATTEAGNLHVAGDWHHATWHTFEALAVMCAIVGAFLALR